MEHREFFSRHDIEDMIRREFGAPADAEIEWHSDGGGVVVTKVPAPPSPAYVAATRPGPR